MRLTDDKKKGCIDVLNSAATNNAYIQKVSEYPKCMQRIKTLTTTVVKIIFLLLTKSKVEMSISHVQFEKKKGLGELKDIHRHTRKVRKL